MTQQHRLISDITIGVRHRKRMGDIEGLSTILPTAPAWMARCLALDRSRQVGGTGPLLLTPSGRGSCPCYAFSIGSMAFLIATASVRVKSLRTVFSANSPRTISARSTTVIQNKACLTSSYEQVADSSCPSDQFSG
jgi:hypothetical protein